MADVWNLIEGCCQRIAEHCVNTGDGILLYPGTTWL
jgi:hypothetical protein